MVINRFKINGYPQKFIAKTMRHHERHETNAYHNTNTQTNRERKQYIRLPYINEKLKRRALGLLRRCRLADKVSIWFDHGYTLGRVFHPPKERPQCPPDCQTCAMAAPKHRNKCNIKNLIYQINCSLCSQIYLGETGRNAGLRMKEHADMKNSSSAVVQHFKTAHPEARQITFQWQAVHTDLRWTNQRRILEAHYISKARGRHLMNGCCGRHLPLNLTADV